MTQYMLGSWIPLIVNMSSDTTNSNVVVSVHGMIQHRRHDGHVIYMLSHILAVTSTCFMILSINEINRTTTGILSTLDVYILL